MFVRALQAAEEPRRDGVDLSVVEIYTIKQLDVELVIACPLETGAVITAEEHTILGGLRGAVAECFAGNFPISVERVGIADTFAESGPLSRFVG